MAQGAGEMPGQARFQARPFGSSRSDLDLEFEAESRPGLVTALLSRCLLPESGAPYSEEVVWAWSLLRRTRGLTAVAAATRGKRASVVARCSAASCGSPLELDVDLALFLDVPEPQRIRCVPEEGAELELRLPTGNDQRDWLRDNTAGGGIEAVMAQRLVTAVNGNPVAAEWEIPASWVDPVGEALAEQDPLMTPAAEARCPHCGRPVEIELDLEGLLLSTLAQEQESLLQQVDSLARVYHWSEADVLALPARRRRYYLERVQDAGAP